jgi:predicted transposase/invertase (TIGR01784 family)
MGIVVISRLASNPETMWLKMLGDRESARQAFEAIEQLSPDRREKNDIILACIKYCVYLKDIPTELLTPEEQDFMNTMAQIDALYEAKINQAKREGELQGEASGEARGEERQRQSIALNLLRKNIPVETIAEATGLTLEQLQQLRSNG